MYALIMIVLCSCQTTTSQSMEVTKDQDSILCTKVVYTFLLEGEKEENYQIETINKSGEIKDKKIPMPNFIKELYKQSQEKDKTIYFDGNKSLSEQLDNDYCFWSNTTTIRDTSPWITFHKPLQFVHFWDRFEEPKPINEESPDSPTFTYTKKKKQILNYSCDQVIIESSTNRKVCWFTKQLQLKDPTNMLLQFDSVPGTILEMEEYWPGPNYWQYVNTTRVKSIEQIIVPFNFFEVTSTAKKMDSEQAEKLNFKCFVEASGKEKQLSQEEKSKFLGTWILKQGDFGFQIEINDLGNNLYEVVEAEIESNHLIRVKSEKANFYGSNLVANECISYFLNEKGRLQNEQDSFYTFTKLEDGNQLILNSLNYWVKDGGDLEHRNKNMKSTGESNSKVEDLKQKIAKKA